MTVLAEANDFAAFLVLSMCETYGAPDHVSRDTLRIDVGTETSRVDLFEQFEDHFATHFTDDERESVRKIGDILDMLVARDDARRGGRADA
ncbi:hypothetical protein [Brevundimonas naejangsanensis]|uniref:hypothetical protein n=1 Tax=Brevundimonas naejangsanensis TaxID=588932 RepID=UPI0034D441F0